jgi:antitoxin component YwqK of YwqJK toxin-antitoxin module
LILAVKKMNDCIWALLFLYACSRSPVPPIYVDASREKLVTRQGLTYQKGRIFSGWVYELYTAGDTVYLTPYLAGKEEGIVRQWFENKQLKEMRVFRAGKKEGEHVGWYSNGAPRFVYHYKNDLYQGTVREWKSDGQLYKDFNYEDGYESGLQKMWEGDGRLKANYEVREGRKYGLTGSKNCKSPVR